jgi:peptide-methionine (S)-S-oxide reductase
VDPRAACKSLTFVDLPQELLSFAFGTGLLHKQPWLVDLEMHVSQHPNKFEHRTLGPQTLSKDRLGTVNINSSNESVVAGRLPRTGGDATHEWPGKTDRLIPEYNGAEPIMRHSVSLRSLAVGLVLAVAIGRAASPIPPATIDVPLAKTPGKEVAVFAGGCFWGVQSVFQRVKGVQQTVAGYSGGSAKTATYKQVVTETTGHAESVEVTYDPSLITYGQLLRVYFSVAHDPTQLNRQGPDVGTSYRSAIFYTNEDQRRLATAYIAQLNERKVFHGPIVTEVTPLKAFYRAEDYHQDYAYYNPDNPYIQVCDRPKIEALKQQFPELFIEYKPKK